MRIAIENHSGSTTRNRRRPWVERARRLAGLTAVGLLTGLMPLPPAATATQPAGGDSILARIGDRVITPSTFVQEWDRILPNEKAQGVSPEETREIFLDDLVTRHLLALEALKHPKKLLPGDAADLERVRERSMLNKLYELEVVDPIQVEELDYNLFVKELTNILQLRLFLFSSQDAAEAWYARIIGGTPVSNLVTAAAETDSTELRLVEMGYITRESMRDSLARILFALAPGRMTPPLYVDGEWGLYQVVEIRQRIPAVDIENVEEVLNEARKFQIEEARERYRMSLRDSLNIRYYDVALDTLVNRFLTIPPRTTVSPEGVPTVDVGMKLPYVSVEDSALVLAETASQRVEARNVMRRLEQMQPYMRPEIRDREALRAVVDRVAFDRALIERALARHLDEDPDVVAAVQRRYEGFQVYMMYQDSVLARIHPSTQELHEFFAADSAHFTRPALAEVWLLMTADENTADSLLAVARGGADLEELARQNSLHAESAQNGGRSGKLMRGDNPNVDLDDAIFTTEVGEFGGPVQTQNGWVIFQVLEKEEQTGETFESAILHVRTDYQRIHEEEELEAFVARIRSRIPVEVYPERLSLVE